LASSADDLRAVLAAHGIESVLIGAHAANRYRLEVRHTIDVDLLVSTLTGAAEVLRAAGCVVREVAEDGQTYMISARNGSTVLDLLLAETDYQRTAMRRAVNGVLTVEDVIVHKLIAGRPRDLDDIRSILSTGITIDRDFVRDNAQQWDVAERWDTLALGG
jgi:hypothetical protein